MHIGSMLLFILLDLIILNAVNVIEEIIFIVYWFSLMQNENRQNGLLKFYENFGG